MKVHLLVFDPNQVEKGLFRDKIDGIKSIVNWTLFFGNTMCVASERNARTLSKEIQEVMPGVRFIITTVDPAQKSGWLPKTLWRFMNEPVAVEENSDA